MSTPRRSTDYGTVFFHTLLVGAFCVLTATGLRIGADDPHAAWLSIFDRVLPTGHLWFNHLVAGVALTALLAGYACYIWRARLSSRVQLDKARVLSMLRPGRTRWAAINVGIYWILIGGLATEIITGCLLFLGAGRATLTLHLYATFVCLAAVIAHVGLHAAYGGLGQVLRIVRPSRLHVAAAAPDLAELLATHLAENPPGRMPGGGMQGGGVRDPASAPIRADPPARGSEKSATLNAHPIASALALAGAVFGLAAGTEHATRPVLIVSEIESSQVPTLDGDLSDPIWTKAKPAYVLTTQGGDFGGTHQSLVEVRALHDGQYAYFAFVWEDPTRSLKHMPLVKRDGQWFIGASRKDLGDEAKYHEDKFAVLLARPGLPLIGAAIHLARQPLADMPSGSTGRGLHYTVDGSIADVWQWRASHGGPTGHIDNCHIGGPVQQNQQDPNGTSHYSGGFALDPGVVPYQANFVGVPGHAGRQVALPRRIPRDIAALVRAMGPISDRAGESESVGSRWWMTGAESVPFTPTLDAKIPNDTVIPGVLVADGAEETPGSIRGTARWAAGRWTLELARRLHTGSRHDIPIKTGVLMWVAAFDHAEKRHTRHLRPFRLEVE
jgi:hypothetical protein